VLQAPVVPLTEGSGLDRVGDQLTNEERVALSRSSPGVRRRLAMRLAQLIEGGFPGSLPTSSLIQVCVISRA
jgi:hypothetical protein